MYVIFYQVFLHTVEEKVTLLWNWNSLLDFYVLFLQNTCMHSGTNQQNGENEAFLDAYKLLRSKSAPTECSDGDRGATGTISLIWTLVLMFWLDLFRASFLLTSCLMGLLRLVVLWCVGWAISGKTKGKTGQKTWAGWGTGGGKSRVNPHMWAWEILASPQQPANEWEDLWKGYYSKDTAKLFPEVHKSMGKSQWAQAAAKRISGCIYKKNWCEFFEVLEQGPREVWLCILGAFKILTTKDLQQPDLALKLILQAVALGDLQRSLPT